MSEVAITTMKRIASALVALPLYIFCIWTDSLQNLPILLISIAISSLSLYEYYMIVDKSEEGSPFKTLGLISAVIINIIFYLFAFDKISSFSGYIPVFDSRMITGFISVFFTIMLIMQIFKRPIKGGIYSVAVTLFGLIYIVFSFSHMILMKGQFVYGLYYILILNVIVMANDSGAYFGGVFLGKHKTNFEVSPNKSWEGYFTGLMIGMFGAIITNQILLSFQIELFSIVEAAILGFVFSILGSIGDLVESAVKRDGAIKDSGSIIPGHGGMWDTFDAILFTMPLFYYYLILSGAK